MRRGFGGICLVEQTEQKFRRFESVLTKKRRERLKSAPYLRLKKLKKLFEIVEGGTFGFFWKSNLLRGVTSQTSDIACWGGGPFGDKKNFEKKSHSAEKTQKGGPYSLVRFCILR